MPLKSGKSEKVFSSNVSELYHANANKPEGKKRSREQILAIAYAKKREAQKKKGK